MAGPMMAKRFYVIGALLLGGGLMAGLAWAQRSARQDDLDRGGGLATWKVDEPFQKDVFTFVRIIYSVDGRHGYGSERERWHIDAPDSDLNFSFRLQQVTSLKVNPDGK